MIASIYQKTLCEQNGIRWAKVLEAGIQVMKMNQKTIHERETEKKINEADS
jgi:hypothetical protein